MRMTVYSCLPTYGQYQDRYRMFAAMCEHGVKVRMTVFHGGHPPRETLAAAFEPLPLPAGTTILSRREHIRRYLGDIDADTPTILHDGFTLQLGLEMRSRLTVRRRPGNVRNVLSLYSPISRYFPERLWMGADREFPTWLREWPYHFHRYIPMVLSEAFSCHCVDAITGNSQEIVDGVRRYYGIRRQVTRFVGSEVDTAYYSPGPAARERLDIPRDRTVVLYAGKFQRLKGIATLLRAFELFARERRDALLVMVGNMGDAGKFWFKDLLGGLAARERVLMREPVGREALRDYYRSCDLLVVPTHFEGSPRVVKEAIACGLPVVTSRISGNLAIDPEEEALVFAPDWRPAEYAQRMLRLVEDRSFREARIEAGLRAVQSMSIERTAGKYLDLYRSLF